MNQSHWIRDAKSTYAPNSIVSVCVGTRERTVKGSMWIAEATFDHVCVTASNRKNSRWSDPTYLMFKDRDDFWNWLQAYGTERRRTYCFAPIASNALTLLGFWELLTARGAVFTKNQRETVPALPADSPLTGDYGSECSPKRSGDVPTASVGPQFHLSSYVITGKVDLLKYRSLGKSFAWASCRAYFDCDETDLADAIKFKWTSEIHSDENSATTLRNARDRSFLWMFTLQKLCDWWREIDGGPWGMTTGQLAMSFFRKRAPERQILVHNNESVSSLEESAIFGGRVSLWCRAPIGDVEHWTERYGDSPPIPEHPSLNGQIIHVDVRSMYPSILHRERFPVQLIGEYHSMSIAALENLIGEMGVIARCVLSCKSGEFPRRIGQSVTYPIGRFSTTLVGPELVLALRTGVIEFLERVAVYRLGRPFEECAGQLLRHRIDASIGTDRPQELFCKALANSLGGKLAQRRYSWVPRPNMLAERDWGAWSTIDYTTQEYHVYRGIAGLVLERISPKAQRRNMSACYAYLTAYGRSLMHVARMVCQPSLVLSQDTDGLWLLCSEDVQHTLERIGRAVAPYLVRINKAGRDGFFLSPSHYWIDGRWTLSGFQGAMVASDTLNVVSTRTTNPITQPCDRPVDSIRIHRHVGRLSCMNVDGAINADGFIVPTVLSL